MMTKYDYIFNSQDKIKESLNEQQAVASITVITTIVDSGIDNIDAESLADILWDLKIFDEYSEEEMLETVDILVEIAEYV